MSSVSSKNQITIPTSVLREARIAPGDEMAVRVTGDGRIEVERVENLIDRWAGSMPPEVYEPSYLDTLRDEWEESS